jgi:predicted nucleic acid-binding Zn finger protein
MMDEVKSDSSTKFSVNCSSNSHSIFIELERTLLDDLKSSYEKDKCIGDELLESLHFIYKSPLLEALNQIDKIEKENIEETSNANLNYSKSLVVQIKCEKSSKNGDTTDLPHFYQVKGSIGINYYLFENVNYCSCSSFKFNIFHKFNIVYCKHMILIKLLNAMNKIPVKYVKENEFIELIKQIE